MGIAIPQWFVNNLMVKNGTHSDEENKGEIAG